MMKENIRQSEKIANGLNTLLSDYQIYYQNLRALHWLVKGEKFFILHEKYEEWYDEAADTIDEIAERILMIDGIPMHTYDDFMKESEIEPVKNIRDGKQGIIIVMNNSNQLLERMRIVLKAADESGDEGTIDLLSGLIGSTEKRIWMLRSFMD